MSGFIDRLVKEMSVVVSDKTTRYIVVPNVNRAFLAWQGGAIVSQMSSFWKNWISLFFKSRILLMSVGLTCISYEEIINTIALGALKGQWMIICLHFDIL